MVRKDFKSLHNEELVDMLFNEEDRVPRAAADEIVRRAGELLPMLCEIVMDRGLWMLDPPEWWAPIHATYLTGAIGGEDSLVPLLSALRWSDAYDNEWVTEDLPSILGSLGDISWKPLIAAVTDRVAGWSARSIAMDALGSQAIRFPSREEEAMSILGRILKDNNEEYGARRSAVFVLLDFRRADLKKDIVAFAKREKRMQQQFPDYRVAFTAEEVEVELMSPRLGLDIYTRDWMTFYDPEEIRRRQERWQDEDRRSRHETAPQETHAGRQSFLIGHDDLCPCGSGKSYKRCCLRKLH